MGKYYLGLQSGTQTNFSVVDGSGVIADLDLSGIYLSVTGLAGDSDKLDGQHGSYYRDAGNLTGTLYIEITGGVGDAATLNGQSGSYYRNIANITGDLTSGSSLLYGDGSGRFANATIGSGLLFSGGVLHVTGGGSFSGSYTGRFSGYIEADSVQFNTGTTGAGTLAVGELEWADDLGTLQFGLKGGNITHYIGQQLFERVKNQSASTLAKGTVVYVSGAQGNRIVPLPAIATADISSATVFGVVAESIPAGSEGFVIQDGILQGVNTTGYAEGSILWLSPTVSGAITTTKPIAPDHLVMVGFCVRSHQSAGEIVIKIQNGYEIKELHDVRILNEQNGQILAYNSASGVWFNTNITGGANIAVTSNGSGSVTIATTSGSYTGNFVGTASNADLLDNLDSTYFRNAANLTGTASLSGTFSGLFRANASTTGTASINLPHGTAPTSPVDGDIWTTASGLYARISGVSVGPYSTGGGGGADEFARTIALLGL